MKKNKLIFSVKKDEDGYAAQCLEFPGIITEADTKRELVMIHDTVKGYFEAFSDDREKLSSIKKSEVIVVTIKLPVLSWRDVLRILRKSAFWQTGQTDNHIFMMDDKHKVAYLDTMS